MKRIFIICIIFLSLVSCNKNKREHVKINGRTYTIDSVYEKNIGPHIYNPNNPNECKACEIFHFKGDYYLADVIYDNSLSYDHLDGSPPHYPAHYKIFKVAKSKYGHYILIYYGHFDIEFAGFGCSEDSPDNMMKDAFESNMSKDLKDFYEEKMMEIEVNQFNARLDSTYRQAPIDTKELKKIIFNREKIL